MSAVNEERGEVTAATSPEPLASNAFRRAFWLSSNYPFPRSSSSVGFRRG